MNYKVIALIEALMLVLILTMYIVDQKQEEIPKDGLLSPRIYTNLLKPQSRLIYNFEPLESALNDYTSTINGTVAVYLLNLRDGASLGINEEMPFEPASLNKLPIAILTLREIEKGDLSLDDELVITENYTDSASGSLFKKVGEKVTVREALDAMLINSDNTAAKVLLNRINPKEWNALSEYLNYYHKEDNLVSPYYSTSAESTVNLFSSLYLSTLLKEDDSEYILSRLIESDFPIHQLAHIPSDVRISHKFGTFYYNNEKDYHDCGIIYFKVASRIGYCVMTKNVDSKEAEKIIGEIVSATYQYTSETDEFNKMQPL